MHISSTKEGSRKRSPLEVVALTTMALALLVVVFSFSHILGIGILSRLFPEMGKPNEAAFSSLFSILFDTVIPVFCLSCILYVIMRPLGNVLARKNYGGYRAEFVLIAFSLLMTGFALQFLCISPYVSGHARNSLHFITAVLALMGSVVLIIAVTYRYFIDGKPQGFRDYLVPILLIAVFLCMSVVIIFLASSTIISHPA